jgi:hypothetical protein
LLNAGMEDLAERMASVLTVSDVRVTVSTRGSDTAETAFEFSGRADSRGKREGSPAHGRR